MRCCHDSGPTSSAPGSLLRKMHRTFELWCGVGLSTEAANSLTASSLNLFRPIPDTASLAPTLARTRRQLGAGDPDEGTLCSRKPSELHWSEQQCSAWEARQTMPCGFGTPARSSDGSVFPRLVDRPCFLSCHRPNPARARLVARLHPAVALRFLSLLVPSVRQGRPTAESPSGTRSQLADWPGPRSRDSK